MTDSKSMDGVMHITGMASGTLLHSAVANMPYCPIIVEVPKGHMEGIHSVVSRNVVFFEPCFRTIAVTMEAHL